MAMRKRASILFASTMTVAGLAAGVTPAHATPKFQEDAGVAYSLARHLGDPSDLQANVICAPIFPDKPSWVTASSAVNTSHSSTITLYFTKLGSKCVDSLAELRPGESDNGYMSGTSGKPSELGSLGASYYTST
jgi:hypothetical protein